MPRKATGQVIPPKDGRGWAIRFRAYGKRHYVALGGPEDGWTRERAQAELRHVLADIERSIWRPPEPAPAPEVKHEPTFHEFASEWFERHQPEWREGTAGDYQWALSYHLLPFFGAFRLSAITVEQVDRYKATKLREGRLAPATLNKTLVRLAQILDEAVEYGYLERNVARGRRRRVKARAPQRSWVEPEQLPALLDAADSWFRPVLATLAGSGLRVGEAVALEWRDVNLATGTLTVRDSKTDAGAGRRVDLPVGLIDELAEWKARSPEVRPSGRVFICRARKGRRSSQTKDNIGRRLKTTIRRANRRLVGAGIEPISERVSPHALRRTYASLRGALHDDPIYIAEQIGHRDPRFTLSVYAKAAKRRERLPDAYREPFDRALHWAAMGSIGSEPASDPARSGDRGVVERA
jgi:integrase